MCDLCSLLFCTSVSLAAKGDDNGPSLIPPLLVPLFGHSVSLSLASKGNREETFLFVSRHSHLYVFVLALNVQDHLCLFSQSWYLWIHPIIQFKGPPRPLLTSSHRH